MVAAPERNDRHAWHLVDRSSVGFEIGSILKLFALMQLPERID